MTALNLPEDLRSFLAAGTALEYDAGCSRAGAVTLFPLDRLMVRTLKTRLSESSEVAEEDPHAGEKGYYLVPAVSLVASCQRYRPAGLLLWLPEMGLYGSWDDDHRTLWVFPDLTWAEIVAGPVPFLNACWEPRRAAAKQARLWESCEWEA
jgi:hypothetical protein